MEAPPPPPVEFEAESKLIWLLAGGAASVVTDQSTLAVPTVSVATVAVELLAELVSLSWTHCPLSIVPAVLV